MIEKIEEVIDKNKKDIKIYQEYIKCFCDSEKVNEYYKDDDEFQRLKKDYLNKKEEEY